jgi:AcrR family transcriptional regulator
MAKAAPPPDRRPDLRAEQRSVADARILEGAMAVFAERGLEGTVDDVSAASGVSRRTVFRHFDSHGELFAAAMDRILATFEERLPGPPRPGEDWDAWLLGVARTVHGLNHDLLGRGFWYVHADWPGAGPEFRAVRSDWAGRWRRMASRLAGTAWTSRDLPGSPPRWVEEAFVGWLSGPGLAGLSPPAAAALSARVLSAVVARAGEEQRATP